MALLDATNPAMKIPLAKIEMCDEDIRSVTEVLRSGWIMQGPRVEAFEKAVAQGCRVPHAVATSSGTTALHLALEAVGVQHGDEVIVPSFSWIASANAVHYCGATPVFCDVDAATYNMTPATVEPLITDRTRVILIVHQFGMPCDMDAFADLATRKRLILVEDAACAIGSRYRGEPIGSCRDARAACLSFHPRKVVTTGEGGMVLTKDPDLAKIARTLRNHGLSSTPPADTFTHIGYNYRMTDIQAALGAGQMERLPQIIAQRRSIAARYRERLGGKDGIRFPLEPVGCESNFQSCMIRLTGIYAAARDPIAARLAAAGVATRKSIAPIHHQPCYSKISRAVLPETDRLADDGLVLPLFPSMTDPEVDFVCDQLEQALTRSGR